MKRFTPITICVMTALATSSACSSPSEAPDVDSVWFEPSSYTYVVQSSCGERSFLGTFKIGVANGVVVHIEALDESAEIVIESSANEAIPTLGELVAEYAAAKQPGPLADGEADFARLIWSLDRSHPSSITIDYNVDATDDEACYSITDFSEVASD